MKLIDLTQKFTSEMPVYPGDTRPELKETSTVAKDGFGHFHITTGMHVGTHIDGPLHFIEGGKKLSEYGPEKFIGRGVLIDATMLSHSSGVKEIGTEFLKDLQIDAQTVVLVHTDMSKKFREAEYYTDSPVLTEELGNALVKAGVKMVGMDMNGPDKPPFNVHKILLGAEVLIIENLTNLDQLVGVKEFEVIALPVYFDTEAAPARVVARII